MKIRAAEPNDLAALCRFDAVARAELARRTFIARAMREKRCRIVDVEGAARGYAVISHHFFERSFIDLVYVDPGWRTKGLGRMLLQAMEPLSRSTSLFTSTNRSNDVMLGLLEKIGYQPAGIIYHLDAGDPECVFVKVLDGNGS